MKTKPFLTLLLVTSSMMLISPAMAGPVEDGNAGLDALNNGDYARAVSLFTRAIASGKLAASDREFAYSQRGAAYLKQGKNSLAIIDFQRALKIKPDDADAQAGLAEAQSGQSTSAAAPRAGRTSNPQQDAQNGMNAMSSGDYGRAIQLFSSAIDSGRLNPDDTELALLSRGKAYTQKGQYSSAVTDLNRALHIHPEDQEAQDAFGKALTGVKAATPVDGIDQATCNKNYSTVGSIISGKTYTAFAEYPTLSKLEAFAGVYNALPLFSPSPGTPWAVTNANLDAGAITAQITIAGSPRTLDLEARIEPLGAGSKITIREVVPSLMITLDLKGTLCNTLAAAAKG